MRRLTDALGFHLFRRLERRLSPEILWKVCAPLTTLRGWRFRRAPALALPGCIQSPEPLPPYPRSRIYLNRMLEWIPDRLATPAWQERCQWEGMEYLQQARVAGQPVVLACLHSGPYPLLRFWLRAAGVPVTVLIRGETRARTAIRWKTDPLTPFPEVPPAFGQDRLREMIACIQAGNPVIMAVDTTLGRTQEVPVCDGWRFAMATGALRLAARQGAALIAGMITEEAPWRYRIRFSPPVPQALLQCGDDFSAAGAALMPHFLEALRRHPEQMPPALAGFFLPPGANSPPPCAEGESAFSPGT